MARRIVFVQNAGFQADPQSRLFVDQWVDIDWKHKVFENSWTGEIAGGGPSYEVGFLDPYSSTISEHGVIRGEEDIAWLRSAIDDRHPESGPMELVARIHQLRLARDGRKGFEIEVLTGPDAEPLLSAAKREQAIGKFKAFLRFVPFAVAFLWLFS
jgi:hypothetical protein